METIRLTKDVMVSDPCYKAPLWCQLELNNVKPGNYKVYMSKRTETVEINGEQSYTDTRCALLTVIHEDFVNQKLSWTELGSIGVDSGQAGIFSKESYRNDDWIKETPRFKLSDMDEGDKWYAHMCDKTLSDGLWGVYDCGVVSSSGYGDGGYTVLGALVNDEIVAICIDYGFELEPEFD